jgi:hypothetical protein
MRNSKRIPICLELFKKPKILQDFLNYSLDSVIHTIYVDWKLIEETWLKYPDLRFGQLLCNLRLISNIDIENHIWNVEEDNWLIDNGYCNIEEIKFWGVNFYKNDKPRKKTKYVLLKNLKIDHIINIIKFFENRLDRIPIKYLEYFKQRINE